MRSLRSSDIFSACRLLSAIGFRDEFKKIAENATNIKDLTQFDVGYDLIFGLVEKATTSKAEKEWYSFFANIFEVSVDEVKNMNPCDFLDKVIEVADVEQWKAFFMRVASLMKQK